MRRSISNSGYRYCISKKVIQKLICPSLLYNGLGKSRDALSQSKKEIKWLDRNINLNFKLKIPVGVTTLTLKKYLFSSFSFDLYVYIDDNSISNQDKDINKLSLDWKTFKKPYYNCIQDNYDNLFPPVNINKLPSLVDLPFEPTTGSIRHGGVLPIKYTSFSTYFSRLTYGNLMHLPYSVERHLEKKKLRRALNEVLIRHATDGFTYNFQIKPSINFMRNEDIILEVENSLKNLGLFNTIREGYQPLDYSKLFSVNFISYLEMPIIRDIGEVNPKDMKHCFAIGLYSMSCHSPELQNELLSNLNSLYLKLSTHPKFSKFTTTSIRYLQSRQLLRRFMYDNKSSWKILIDFEILKDIPYISRKYANLCLENKKLISVLR